MTPQEKAIELIGKFKYFVDSNSKWNEYDSFLEIQNAKKCAKIAVEEIINFLLEFSSLNTVDYTYYNEVLKEIDNI